MKIQIIFITLASSLILATNGGCSMFGANPKSPSKVESQLYNTVTNYVPQIVTKTNYVNVEIPMVFARTNEMNVISWLTNTVVETRTNTVTETNQVPAYTLTASDNAKVLASGIGAGANAILPGSGDMITMGILALLGIWGHARSYKKGTVNDTLAQEVESIREFIKTLPSGTNYDNAITSWLQSHQVESGVAQQVLNVLANSVSNPEAVAAAKEISATIAVASSPPK